MLDSAERSIADARQESVSPETRLDAAYRRYKYAPNPVQDSVQNNSGPEFPALQASKYVIHYLDMHYNVVTL